MAYDSNIPLPQGATKESEIALDRDQPVLNLPKGTSMINVTERMRALSVDSIRRNNLLMLSRGKMAWDGTQIDFTINQKGNNVVLKVLQTEPGAAAYIELVLTGAISCTADLDSTDTLQNIATHTALAKGMYVFGPGIPSGTFIINVISPTSVQLSQAATITQLTQALDFATQSSFPIIGNTHSSTLVDGIQSTVGMVPGMYVTGSGIPANTTIATIVDANSLTLSNAATTTVVANAMTGYQILTPESIFKQLPLGDREILFFEINRDQMLASTVGTAQWIIENGVNGGSSAVGRMLKVQPMTPSSGMPQLLMTASGPTATFTLPFASREDYTEGATTYQPIFWVPHGLRWEVAFVGFLGELPTDNTNGVPVGASLVHRGGPIPNGFLPEDGTLISRALYPALFAQIRTRYGIGDGLTTFATPDSRGYVDRMYDGGSGRDPDALVRLAQTAGTFNVNGTVHEGTSIIDGLLPADVDNITVDMGISGTYVPTGFVTAILSATSIQVSTVTTGVPLGFATLVEQDLTYTAVLGGFPGNNVSIEYVDDALSGFEYAEVNGDAIIVHIEGGVTDATTLESVYNAATAFQAILTVQDVGYQAQAAGYAGNSISIEYTGGGLAGSEIVTVTTNAISVQIEDGVSTSTQIATAINGYGPSFALVTATDNNPGTPQFIAAQTFLTHGSDDAPTNLATVAISGTGSNPQTAPIGPTNLSGGTEDAPDTLAITNSALTNVGSTQADTVVSHDHGGLTGTENQAHNHNYTTAQFVEETHQNGGGARFAVGATTATENQAHDHAIPSQGGSETRGKNIACNKIIKY